MTSAGAGVRYGTAPGRWVLAATVLGSGIAFLDSTVVNIALPAIGEDLEAGLSGLQWTLDAYLVTLTALLLLGGSLGDRLGRRRVFVVGLAGFAVASLLCGIAPTIGTLIAARALQGVAAAFLVPGSLAIISASFHADDRGRAVGAWSGWSGATSALGPFVGGWLIDAISWRAIFLINLPLVAAAIWIAAKHVPDTRDLDAARPDLPGAAAVTLGLAGVAYGLIEGGTDPGVTDAVVGAAGVMALVAFVFVERTSDHPILPLGLFRSRQFTGANLTTLAVYTALGGALFLVVIRLQLSLDYSALEAGLSLLPLTVLMLLLSPSAGQLAQVAGPRLPMTVGPAVASVGLALFARVEPGETYLSAVLPAVTVFGLGLTITVAPLTATVLAAVEERHAGVASGINNGVARLAGLLAVALLPVVAGIETGEGSVESLGDGFSRAMWISAGVCLAGSLTALMTIRQAMRVPRLLQPATIQPCHEPCVAERDETEAA